MTTNKMTTKKSLCCGADMIIGSFHSTCLACMKNCFWQKNEDLTLAEVYAVKDDVISFKLDNRPSYREIAVAELSSDWPNSCWLENRYSITDRKSWHRHEKKLTEWPSTGDWFATIKIGDTLTAEQAQKYIEAGGFVKSLYIYRFKGVNQEFYDDDNNRWLQSTSNRFHSSAILTAVENPEKAEVSEVEELKNEIEGLTENLADEQIKVKELNENCHGLKKEVEDLKSQLEAERKISEWLPFPENKPSFGGFILIKNNIDQVASVFYNVSYDQFQVSGSSHFQIDKSTIRFFREV